ncbi:MAG: hypothetical protein V4808_07035 [Pseudomonadota bacterium]
MALGLLPSTDDALPNPGDILILDPNEIEIGDRLRPIDMVFAGALGSSIRCDGQIHAIHVSREPNSSRWYLAGPGGHRLMGARLEGIPIEAKFVSSDKKGQRRREAVENYFRRKDDPIERAAAVAELVLLHKQARGIDPAKDGRTVSANARWQKQIAAEADDATATIAVVYGLTDQVATELGFSARTIRDDLLLYRRLPPSLVARLRGARHPILGNASQLRTLAKLNERDQLIAADYLIGDGQNAPIKSLGDVTARMRGANRAPSDPETKRLSTFIGTFQRMGLPEKKGALAELAPLVPAGCALATPASKSATVEQCALDVRLGLEAAYALLIKLSDGEPVDDDDINAARVKVQMALLTVNMGGKK